MRTTAMRGLRRAGFTLIELLAVILILGILAGALWTVFGSQLDSADVRLTRTFLQTTGAALSSFSNDEGDFPRSTFPADQSDGAGTNEGAECLVVALFSKGRNGYGIEYELVNTDGDKARKPLADDFESRELFELMDRWDNPIAYFHNQDYGTEQLYKTFDPATGEPIESRAKAFKNAQTKTWHEKFGYQLISAGPDGAFGTDDDITPFKR